MTTPDDIQALLAHHDAGATVADLVRESGMGQTRVYALLKAHRPDRKRTRRRTSSVPAKVRGLVASGIKPARVAVLLGVSRAYVYACLKQGI